MAITALPTPPQRNDPVNFAARGDAFMAALPTFTTEANALAVDVNAKQVLATTAASNAATSETNAATSASNAATSAASALNSPGTNATSTTSLAVSTGSKALTLAQLGKSFSVGQRVYLASAANTANRMVGVITAFTPGTGAMTVNVTLISGSGTFTDWIISLAGESELPAVTGADVGKLLGVVSGPAYGLVAGRGAGAASPSGNTTLTSSSPALQRINSTAPGQWVKLPNATTMAAGVALFSLHNLGAHDLEVQNAAGVALGYIISGETVLVSLSDISTSAGIWTLQGHSLYGVLTKEITVPLTTGSLSVRGVQVLDSTRDLLFLGGSSGLYGVVYDATASTFGALVLINATSATLGTPSVLNAPDQTIVVAGLPGGNMEVRVITTSGSTITAVGAAATVAYGGSSVAESIIKVAGVGFVTSVYNGSTGAWNFNALTLSGTTLTIGSSVVSPYTGITTPPKLYDFGSGVVLGVGGDGSSFFARPYTQVGTVLTAGTTYSIGTATQLSGVRQLSSGRIAVVYRNAANTNGGVIISVTGAVATGTVVTLGVASNATATARIHAVGNQVIVAMHNYGNPQIEFNVLTDNAGTAVAGTPIVRSNGGVSGDFLRAIAQTATTMTVFSCTNTTAASGSAYQLGISGNNCVLLNEKAFYGSPIADGGTPLPTFETVSTSTWKTPVGQNFLQGTYGAVAGVTISSTGGANLWETVNALPDITVIRGFMTDVMGDYRWTHVRNPEGSYRWSSKETQTGLTISLQRLKVA